MEEEFFKREDAKLLEKLRALKDAETTRETLAKATGITNAAVLDKLAVLKIAAALSVLPFVEVAWADGSIDAKERTALIAHARTKGFAPGSRENALLEMWLDQRPAPRFFEAWTHLVHGLCEHLNSKEVAQLRTTLVDRARSVAEASGGVLGLGKVSASEAAMLKKLEVPERGTGRVIVRAENAVARWTGERFQAPPRRSVNRPISRESCGIQARRVLTRRPRCVPVRMRSHSISPRIPQELFTWPKANNNPSPPRSPSSPRRRSKRRRPPRTR
jgi:hypothetical protein